LTLALAACSASSETACCASFAVNTSNALIR
jgi:hypothetical protein